MEKEDKIVLLVFCVTVLTYLIFYFGYGFSVFLQLSTSFAAGVLGILFGFALDRNIEKSKDNRIKIDFLNLIRGELEVIRGLIYPQVNAVNLLYTDIWDSMVSSGVVRLLSTDQVTKLSKLYKGIKGTSYEAEWVRRDFEELQSTAKTDKEKRKCIEEKCIEVRDRHFERMKNLSKELDEVLKESWLNAEQRS
jgi:hypothetical protein